MKTRSRKRPKPREKALLKVIEHYGNAAALARALGVSDAAVGLWYRVPTEHVFALEKATGIPRTELRADLYPPDPRATPARKSKPQRRPHGQQA
jgi:DNA-binding transcriptional regulator YdaS (Cro superfamily)